VTVKFHVGKSVVSSSPTGMLKFRINKIGLEKEINMIHKPESKPMTPLALSFLQGSSKEDCVTVWFF